MSLEPRRLEKLAVPRMYSDQAAIVVLSGSDLTFHRRRASILVPRFYIPDCRSTKSAGSYNQYWVVDRNLLFPSLNPRISVFKNRVVSWHETVPASSHKIKISTSYL